MAERQAESIRFPDSSGRSLRELVDSCPDGATIELAPGRFAGPVVLRRPIAIRGAGDLTRISGGGFGSVLTVDLEGHERVLLESLLLEDAESHAGAGLCLLKGRVRAHNLHIQSCRAEAGGGGIHVAAGMLDMTRLRAHDVAGERGGLLYAGGNAVVTLRDSQVFRAEARFGGAIAVEGAAAVVLEGITIGRTRATMPSGGQAIYVSGTDETCPTLQMRRVRLEDAPLGMPVIVDPRCPGEVCVSECDIPRMVLGVSGIIDGGQNNWR